MSVAAKKHLTEIVVGRRSPKKFLVPADKAKSIRSLIAEYAVEDEGYVSIDEAFAPLIKQFTKAGAALQGCRLRDEMTQVELAQALGTSQTAVAAMETGSRPISKQMAMRLAEVFDTDYRVFFEPPLKLVKK